jgi:hypothetical protein
LLLAGDAILNVRKAKLIPSYELCIKVKWQGSTADGQAGSGLIELPYVADENHDEDPEIRWAQGVEDSNNEILLETSSVFLLHVARRTEATLPLPDKSASSYCDATALLAVENAAQWETHIYNGCQTIDRKRCHCVAWNEA